MVSTRRRTEEFRQSVLAIVQAIFAALIIFIFFLAFIIQSGAIPLPPWAKTFQGATPEQQSSYAASLLAVIIVLSAIIIAAGTFLTRGPMFRFPGLTGHSIDVTIVDDQLPINETEALSVRVGSTTLH
ncbi:hypothetical protein F5Y16DRAFT_397451 [Xylariaceae sp. FL0255]|nr:hypothetical protein F5Y16DRAFT_397451 [Xylariaceae sp. FL0255]